MNYTLKHLRYFVATGETGSVTKAAEQVHVSQPSISAAIAHLEAVFGLQLFIRTECSIPTPFQLASHQAMIGIDRCVLTARLFDFVA